MITEINVGKNQKFRQYFFEQPVDQNKTRIFFVNMRNFMLEPQNDGPIHARNKIIAQQDIEILVDVYPPRTPTSNTKEVLMPADKAVVAYREWLQQVRRQGLAHRLGRVHPAQRQGHRLCDPLAPPSRLGQLGPRAGAPPRQPRTSARQARKPRAE